jgi:hypothetical protein
MEVHLLPGPHYLPRLHERLVPYFEIAPAALIDGDDAMPSWSSRLQRWKGKIQEIYRSLVARFPLHERLCTALGTADQIQVRFPGSLKTEDARYAFEHFLKHQASKHRFWMVCHGVMASFGALMTPIPGPNIFFFYPAVRFYSHYRARSGATKALSREIRYLPDPILGQFLSAVQHKPRVLILPLLAPLAESLELPRLPDFYQEVILHKHS